MAKDEFHFDSILSEIGGFGKFQIIIYVLAIFPALLASFYSSSFIFTTGNLDYRCRIPQCDHPEHPESSSSNWLEFAIPHTKNGVPEKCLQYNFEGNDDFMHYVNHQCSKQYFNQSHIIRCQEFVYEIDSLTILNDFNLTCEENAWKLTTIGTIKNTGGLIILPITGVISDRFGRKFLLIGSLLLSGIFGTLASFSINYWMYAILEFITSMCTAGIFMSVFILGMEIVGANKRVLGGTIMSQVLAIGQVILGFLAMHITNYRRLLQAIYLPTIVVLSYIRLIPESVRWLMNKGQNKKALKIIYKAAKTNHLILSDSTLESIYAFSGSDCSNTHDEAKPNQFVLSFRSKILIIRFLICCFCWFTNGLVYFGISVHAVTLAGNEYINFILISLAELPANVITYFVMQNVRRKWSLALPMFLSAVLCVAIEFVHDYSPVWRLILFGIGKCSISISFTVAFVYTSELFPTPLRHSFFSSCLMGSRIGAMIAPLLAHYLPPLPAFLFGGTSIVSGFLVLLLPETFSMILPDTIEEAERIGRRM